MKVLFHVNNLWGVGHYSRIAAIANAFFAHGGTATILAGNTPLAGRAAPGVTVIPLDPIRAKDPSYSDLVDAAGQPPDKALWQRRRATIETALIAGPPDIVVTETFPFGRRKLQTELLHLVTAARAHNAKVVCSLRDIPTTPRDPVRLAECAAHLRDFYDGVLVHGDPQVTDFAKLWPGEIPAAVHPTGYVVDRPLVVPRQSRSGVIVSAGAGGNSASLLTAALAARRGGLFADEPWTLVAGPKADLAALDDGTQLPRVTLLDQASDLPDRIAAARLSISRGGYNTLLETIAASTPAVIVPTTPNGEMEQAIRAAQFAARGFVVHLPEDALTPGKLADAASRALANPLPHPGTLNLDGAAHSAALLAEIAEAR